MQAIEKSVDLLPTMRVRAPSDTLFNVIGGESVLLSLKSERYRRDPEPGRQAGKWRVAAGDDRFFGPQGSGWPEALDRGPSGVWTRVAGNDSGVSTRAPTRHSRRSGLDHCGRPHRRSIRSH